jgi:hypothetical protein
MIVRYPTPLVPAPRALNPLVRLAASVVLTIAGFGIGVVAIEHVNWLHQSSTVHVSGSFTTREAANYSLQSSSKFGVQRAAPK